MSDRSSAAYLFSRIQTAIKVLQPYSRQWVKGVGGVCLGLFCIGQDASAQEPKKLVVAAANSTCTTLKKAGAVFAQRYDVTLSYTCKSSGRLAKGIKGGMITPDFYISANEKWIKDLARAGFVDHEIVSVLWGNELVLAHPRTHTLDVTSWEDLATMKVTQLLLGDPSTAPFGRYSKQALQSAGLWEQAKSKVSTRKHITLLADDLSGAGAGTAGMLFSTNLTDQLQTALHVPAEWHDPIRYYGAPLVGKEQNPVMVSFFSFLMGPEAQEIFNKAGFKILP